MTNTSLNNKRIAKNTLLLYFRMFFMMFISLFTSRVVLNTLGVEDYGIYNVVGGVVTMFGFLNAAMSTSTQRYLTFELGRGSFEGQQRVFSTSVQIHALIAILIFILGETIGLWFLYEKMVIAESRMHAALWVYQCSVVSTIVMILGVPYNASIIAHEKMSAFAYISVLEVVFKLLIVYLLVIYDIDKLKLYAVLILCIQLFIYWVYIRYCGRYFVETRLKNIFDKNLFREMLGFAGWNLLGNSAAVLSTHGLNILLNMFFGPSINAARGIAVQVQGAIQQFSGNFQMALNPQITKTYAQGDLHAMHKLIFRSSRFTFLLLFILSLPVMLEAPIILETWLKLVPPYTVSFLCIILVTVMIDSMAQPIMQAAAATGRVRRYQSILGGILLTIVPISYIFLKCGSVPESVFLVHLVICCMAFIVRLFIVRTMIQFPVRNFMVEVMGRVIIVALISLPLPMLVKFHLPNTLWAAAIVILTAVMMVAISGYYIGMESNERIYIYNKVKEVLFKTRNK